MFNFKKLLFNVLTLFIILNLIFPIQSFSYHNNQNGYFCFNFKELDEVFEENKLESTKDIIDEINRCDDNIKNLNNDFNILENGNLAKCGFTGFAGSICGYFVSKFSNFKKYPKQKQQKINPKRNIVWFPISIGALIGGLMYYAYAFFTTQVDADSKEDKLLQEKSKREQLIKKFKDVKESNKRKKCILNELLTYLDHKRFVDFIAPQEGISERGTEFCAQLSKSDPKQCSLYLKNNERIIYTEDEKKSFPKYFKELAKEIRSHLENHAKGELNKLGIKTSKEDGSDCNQLDD